ncbi:MAG: FtsX-like permease family protein, partial [Verrucomicrobiota bacterium]
IMNGFGNEIRDKLSDTDGHVRIGGGGIIYQPEPLLDLARSMEGVEAVSPIAEGLAMMMHRNFPAFPFIRAIDVLDDEQVLPLEQYMVMGSMDDLDDDSVLMGAGLARSINATYPGAKIELYSPLMLEELKDNELVLPRELNVAGVYETGYNRIDGNSMVISLRLMQELYGLREGVHGVAIRLTDPSRSEAVKAELNERLESPYYATSWEDQHSDTLWVLNLEKTVMSFIILFIILVAAFSIMSSLLTTVVRKTREIGLLGAMGATSGQIAGVYCIQGLIIGLLGSIAGVLFALLALANREPIITAFARITGSEEIIRGFYGFAILPVHYEASDFIVTITVTIIISVLAGIVPALRAAFMKPADALRNE